MTPVPGESIWETAARELGRNPDSPASLQIMSAVGCAMQPRKQAVDQLVVALEAQALDDGELQRAAVQAAIKHWERECGGQMEASVLDELQAIARSRIDRLKRRPPPMENILGRLPAGTDTGYHLGVHLEGLQGTWHRLWAMTALAFGFRNDVDEDEGVQEVRRQFETLLGRELTGAEWAALAAHARQHQLDYLSKRRAR